MIKMDENKKYAENVFPDMVKVLPIGESGDAKLSHVTVGKMEALKSMFDSPDGLMYCEQGEYAKLTFGGQIWMSDTRMERVSNLEFYSMAKGDVLIAGLGIGMIVIAAAKKPEVKSVTVVESNLDVVNLVWKQIQKVLTKKEREKLHLVVSDIHNFKPEVSFDTIYFDIWPKIDTDNLPEMARLHNRFKHKKRKGGWMGSWLHGYLKRRRDKERREERREAEMRVYLG